MNKQMPHWLGNFNDGLNLPDEVSIPDKQKYCMIITMQPQTTDQFTMFNPALLAPSSVERSIIFHQLE